MAASLGLSESKLYRLLLVLISWEKVQESTVNRASCQRRALDLIRQAIAKQAGIRSSSPGTIAARPSATTIRPLYRVREILASKPEILS